MSSSVVSDPSTWSPRDRARRGAAAAAQTLARYLLVLGAFEAIAVVIDAASEPTPPAPWLATLGLVLRVALGLGLVLVARGFTPWARALGLGAWAFGAASLALVSVAASCVVLADLAPPATVPADVWEPMTRLLGASFLVGALLIMILLAGRVAHREDLHATGRALAWSTTTTLAALVAALVVLEPALLPAWWLGPAAPLLALVVLALARIIAWERALWPVLFGALVGVLLLVMGTSSVLVAGLGALLAIAIATVMPRGPLLDIAAVMSEEPTAAPSRTFIRRLLDGPTESQIGALGSRIGSQLGSGSDEADNLALAYRELGIEPPRPKVAPTAPTPPAAAAPTPSDAAPLPPLAPPPPELPQLEPMAKLEPRAEVTNSAQWVRPTTTRETTALPDAAIARAIDLAELAPWERSATALHQVFRGFVGRACTVVFGVVLMRSPLAHHAWAQLLAFAILASLGVVMTLGLFSVMRNLPPATLRPPLFASAICAAIMTVVDVVLGVLIAFAPELAGPLAIADSALFLVTMGLLLYFLRTLFIHLGQPAARGRVNLIGLELLVFAALGAIAASTSQSGEGDVSWLAIPSGIAAALAGLVFFASFLWLVTDARTLIADWQTRIRRSYDPDASEAGDPDVGRVVAP